MSVWTRLIDKTVAAQVGNNTNLSPVVLHAASNSFAMPTDNTFGGDITLWEDGTGYSPSDADLKIVGSAATTLTGPVWLYGVRGVIAFAIAPLNGSADIKIGGATTGYATALSAVGTFERLAIGPVPGAAAIVPSAGATVTVTVSVIRTVDRT
jgi:hypothetical protein